MIPSASSSYYDAQRQTTLEFVALAHQLWGQSPPRDFDTWFDRNVDDLVAAAVVGQQQVIADSDRYVASVLEETGVSVAAEVAAQPLALVGVASDGRPLDSLLYGSVIHAKGKVADGAPASVAWDLGLQALTVRMHTLLADTARAATGLSIAARPRVGYVRMLVGRSCSRCAILAGRYYPYSAGFLRHPQCNCRHIPAREDTADDLRTDPRLFFDSLTEGEQDRVFTIAGAQAIRDGADMAQVVNARRGAHGLDVAGSSLLHRRMVRRDVYGQQLHTTTEGVTKRGIAGRIIRGRGRNAATTPRLMPEAIYEIADSRDEALRLLRMNGYLLDRPGPSRAAGAGRVTPQIARQTGVPAGGTGGPPSITPPLPGTGGAQFGRPLDDGEGNIYRSRNNRRRGELDTKADDDWRYIQEPDDRATAILQYVLRDRRHVVQIAENLDGGRDAFDGMNFTEGTLAQRVRDLTEDAGGLYELGDYQADLLATAHRLRAWSQSPEQINRPVFRGLAIKGTRDDITAGYPTGHVEQWRYASTTLNMAEAREYAERSGAVPVFWRFKSVEGIRLSPVGRMIDSDEVIVTGSPRVESAKSGFIRGAVFVEAVWE